ncbi:MAG: hypothetical protein ABIA21_02690 [Candidatus Aenigmatarchaeota archaeon]
MSVSSKDRLAKVLFMALALVMVVGLTWQAPVIDGSVQVNPGDSKNAISSAVLGINEDSDSAGLSIALVVVLILVVVILLFTYRRERKSSPKKRSFKRK